MAQRGYLREARVWKAMVQVPREEFLEPDQRASAYVDRPVWIGSSQTMSAPHMVAIMAEALELQPGHRVLEIGTGSGYHAAIAAHLVAPEGSVVSIEYVPSLAESARANLARVGVKNVRVIIGDGGRGAPEHAPYDRIYLTCTAPGIPPPLREQLAPAGILLAPLGSAPARLVRLRLRNGTTVEEDLGPCAFVPLRGEFGHANG